MTRPMIICFMIYTAFFFLSYYHVAGIRVPYESFHVDPPKKPFITEAYKLRQKLFTDYDKTNRPHQHWNTTKVNFTMTLLTVSVDDMASVVAVNMWTRMEWEDEKLKWNSSDYNGLDSINVGSHEIWKPDIYLTNSGAHGTEYYGDRLVVIWADGKVLYVIPTIHHAFCHLDFTYWPFEMNSCKLLYLSWTYDGNEVDLRLTNDSDTGGQELLRDHYQSTSEWIIKYIKKRRVVDQYNCCPEPYISLEFIFELSRAADIYYHVIFIPIVSIVFLILFSFWLRPSDEMRLKINAMAILMVVVFLIYFGIKVPPRPDSMPLIVRFYSGCLFLAIFCLIITAVLRNINKLAYYVIIPRFVTSFFMGKVGRYLGLGHIIHKIESRKSVISPDLEEDTVTISLSTISFNNDEQIASSSKNQTDNVDWILIAAALDRLCFIVCCLIFTWMALNFIHFKRSEFVRDN